MRTGRPGVNISDGKDDANENGEDKEERTMKRSERGILGLAARVECEIFEGHMTPGWLTCLSSFGGGISNVPSKRVHVF